MLCERATRHSKAQNANFELRKCWVHLNHHCARIFISGYHAEIKYKNVLFYFKAFSHVMGYHDDTQNFTIRKYDILAFKWRVLSIFSIPESKVIPKNKRTLVKCPGLYVSVKSRGVAACLFLTLLTMFLLHTGSLWRFS